MNIFPKKEKGASEDLDFLKNDRWLHDTEVRYCISEKKGRWHVAMLFIALNNPLQFLCRYIDHYETQRKARNYAEIMQRNIRKDVRGILKINEYAFNICYN